MGGKEACGGVVREARMLPSILKIAQMLVRSWFEIS